VQTEKFLFPQFLARLQKKTGLEETKEFLNLYKRRGWIFGFLSIFVLPVPVYLFLKAVDSFSVYTFIDLFLSLFLAVLWIGMPALFVFYNSAGRKTRFFAWVWLVWVVVACVGWAIVLLKWIPLT
jgi:hypothetical protein